MLDILRNSWIRLIQAGRVQKRGWHLASQVQASAYLICEGEGFLTVDEDPWLVKDAYSEY